MLSYEMRVGTLGEDSVGLDLFSISTHGIYDSPDEVEVRSVWTNDVSLYEGENVVVVTNYDGEDSFGNLVTNRFSDNVSVEYCNNVDKTFSFVADKYVGLDMKSLDIVIEDTVMYLRFQFNSWHLFRSWENYSINLYFTYPVQEGSQNIEFNGCRYINEYEIWWMYDASVENIDSFMCSVFRNDKYELVGVVDEEELDEKYQIVHLIPETACFTDELYLALRKEYRKDPPCIKYELYEKSCNDGTLMGISCKRINFKYIDVNSTEEYVEIPTVSVAVPLSLESGYDLYQEQNINNKFVDSQIEASKNKTIEMEKYIYHPVFKLNDRYQPIHKIKFNLHFRTREKEGWIVKPDGYWNGMNEDGTIASSVGITGATQFFSYSNRGRQSDLLCYLGFTDADVKYQKSKLKKSFLRLSFYDSTNRANQNLLCYSTIFMDGGNLFTKMMCGSGKKRFYVASGQFDGEDVNIRYDDIKVNREPCPICINQNMDDEEVEKYRLSSQIVVSDRLSKASSEGFYLYLWADNDNGAIPSDIYMRVEFNHAGYGRVIPFTMPYFNTYYRDSFEKVCDIWANHGGWGIVKNEKFSYIHFKYVYDSDSKQHVYYLDPDTYVLYSYQDSSPDELELDLYEAKINFEEEQ